MIAKRERFSKEQLAALLSQKEVLQIVYNSLGTLKFIPGERRFAVVTSGKHEKRAVARNKVRRRLYCLFKGLSPQISAVLYVSKQSYRFDYKTTKTLFYDIFKKISTIS